MRRFTGLEYMYISLANYMGYDKWTWEERLKWGKNAWPDIQIHIQKYQNIAAEPLLLYKSAREIEDVLNNKSSSMVMGIDATASGLQIFAALTGCHDTARNVNLISTGKREDVYTKIAEVMQKHGANVTRKDLKKPVMT